MLMVGTGRMARYLIPAHMSVRPIEVVHVWGRNPDSAQRLVEELRVDGINAHICLPENLQKVAQQVDLISCATMATEPLIMGEWLSAGAHLDLVGSFTPKMRETNNAAMQIGDVFVDTRAGAFSETGDILIPISEGAITEESIVAEFFDLCSGQHRGRADLVNSDKAITVFKSVGAAIEDLAAAILAKSSIN
jgi:ornithine cyclodeaminase